MGSFEETIVREDLIKAKDIRANRYAVYSGGDWPLVSITNKKVDEGKVLIIQDSFGLPFSAFMSFNFRQTDIIDLRYFKSESIDELNQILWNKGLYARNESYSMISI